MAPFERTPKEEVFDMVANALQGYFVNYPSMKMYAFVHPREIDVVYKDRTFEVLVKEKYGHQD
jgi:hypothetical protein